MSGGSRRIFICGVIVSIGAIVGIFFLCTIQPAQPETILYPISLTLDDRKSTTATFSGKPITMFCDFRDSTTLRDVAWHLGSGKILQSPALSLRTSEIQVQLFWDAMPPTKDSLGHSFDSIYISLGGETLRSNTGRVFVTNIPPVVDTIKISRRSYPGRDTIRDTIRTYDTLDAVPIRILAHDANKNVLSSTWSESGISRISPVAGAINATYQLSHTNSIDTINLMVYDGQGGDFAMVIYIISLVNKNKPPVIDSVKVKDTVFAALAQTPRYTASAFDSLRFRVWARDSDASDKVQIQWTGKNSKQAAIRQNGAEMTWACTTKTCKDSLPSGGFRVIDTVVVTVRDNIGALAQASVILVKGSNRPPIVDSLQINDSLVKAAWSALSWSASAGDTIRLRVYSHDPDSLDTAHCTIKARDSLRLKSAVSGAALYVCKDTLYRDTLSLLFSDNRSAVASRQITLDVNNRAPLLDSVQCGDSLFGAKQSFFFYAATGLDTVSLHLFGHDPDAGDKLTDTVFSSYAVNVEKFSSMQYWIACPDSTYNDTLTCAIVDKRLKSSKKRIVIGITAR
jgi:hypothetical protein